MKGVSRTTRVCLRALSYLLEPRSRPEWAAEWAAEIAAAREAGHQRGVRGTLALLRGAAGDAWTSRRLARELARVRGAAGWADEVRMDGWSRDIVQAARALAGRPGFTLVVVCTLALGVGTTTAMFSVVRAVLLRPLIYEDADRLVVLREADGRDGSLRAGMSAATARDLGARSSTLTDVSIADGIHGLKLMEDGRASSLRAWVVSAHFFDAMGEAVVAGRTFLPDEFAAGSPPVVMLSESTWRGRFGGDTTVLGRDFVLDGVGHTVVGVVDRDFKYPSAADAYTPRPPQPADEETRDRATMDVVARIAPGVSLQDVRAELDRIAADLARTYPQESAGLTIHAESLRSSMFGDARPPLLLLLGAVGLVLLLSTANVAGLQLARASARSREYALRTALGATSARIMRLAVAEGLVLSLLGAAFGAVLAYVGVGMLRRLGVGHVPRFDELAMDGPALAFALSAAVACALLAGVVPALRAARVELQPALMDGSRGSRGGLRTSRLRDRIVVVEVGLAFVLVVGAGLLLRSFALMTDNELGFEPEGRLAVQVFAYDDQHRARLDFFDQAAEALRTLPGVEAVGLTSDLPLADDRLILSPGRTAEFSVLGDAADVGGHVSEAVLVGIDHGYVDAMSIAVTDGRPILASDRSGTQAVVVVNAAFVRRYLPTGNAVGEHVRLADDFEARRIVGVLADVRRRGFESQPSPEIYVPLSQRPSNGLTFVVSATAGGADLAVRVREALWGIDPGQAVWAVRPLRDMLQDTVRQRRFITALLTAFGALALALAMVGAHGLVAFSVEQRSTELSVRRALGGDASDIVGLVLRKALTLAFSGLGLGLVGALLATTLLRGLLFGVGRFDPLTFVGLASFVAASIVLAALVPARRAARIDAAGALRQMD